MTAFKHPAFAKLSPRIDRAAKEAEHLTVLEPMAQAYTPEEILRALTPENCRLVALIHRHRPQSITELCRLAARRQPNVSRSLATLEWAGIVSMVGSRPKRPELAVQRVTIELVELQNNSTGA